MNQPKSRMSADQLNLFGKPARQLPDGFRYEPDVLSPQEEEALVAEFTRLPFKEFEFQGFLGKRRTVSYGWHYNFNDRNLRKADPFPDFLLPARDRAAAFAGLDPSELQHVLVTEYREGAAIGWHKDKAVFGDVIGLSLVSPCTFRLRRKQGTGWERASLIAQPRSAYLLRGPSRTEWEHSIPGVETLRYSITFRSFKSEQR